MKNNRKFRPHSEDRRPLTGSWRSSITSIAEREVKDWMLETDPQTRDEASELIEELLDCPRRRT